MPENRTAVQEAVAVASVDDFYRARNRARCTNWAAPTITAEMAAANNSRFDLAAFVEILLPRVWLAGAVACLTVTFIANLRLLLCLHKGVTCEDCAAAGTLERVLPESGLPTHGSDLARRRDRSGATAGLFRPKLLLPTTALQLTDEQLRMVMLHELGHVRGGTTLPPTGYSRRCTRSSGGIPSIGWPPGGFAPYANKRVMLSPCKNLTVIRLASYSELLLRLIGLAGPLALAGRAAGVDRRVSVIIRANACGAQLAAGRIIRWA